MFKHAALWHAIDRLAEAHGLSPSGLAKRAGLDATSFNPSKRVGPGGRKRWPSAESLSLILKATGTGWQEFGALLTDAPRLRTQLPVLTYAEAGRDGFFDDTAFPEGEGMESIEFGGLDDARAFALKVRGKSMEPAYRAGDVLVISPAAAIRKGDRVVVRTKEILTPSPEGGEIMAKILLKQTAKMVTLGSLHPDFPPRMIAREAIAFIARIVWVSQ